MPVFNRAAQMDFMLENTISNTIELYEVKAFEITYKHKIEFAEKYFDENKYQRQDLAQYYINFLDEVIFNFEGKIIYGGGIKQLCSHLLGIINIMEKETYKDKKFKLFSLCFDNPFTPKFESDLNNYKEALIEFKVLVDEFLIKHKLNSRIEYYGFLSSYDYLNMNRTLIGEDNYNYVIKRYYDNY